MLNNDKANFKKFALYIGLVYKAGMCHMHYVEDIKLVYKFKVRPVHLLWLRGPVVNVNIFQFNEMDRQQTSLLFQIKNIYHLIRVIRCNNNFIFQLADPVNFVPL